MMMRPKVSVGGNQSFKVDTGKGLDIWEKIPEKRVPEPTVSGSQGDVGVSMFQGDSWSR